MSQRHSGRERLARDAYNTPAWPTRVLVEDLEREGVLPLRSPRHGGPLALWEPCAGLGQMASELSACGYEVYASDIDGAKSNTPCDFLTDTIWPGGVPSGIGAIITNPPYKRGLVERIIERALEHMKPHNGLVAMLLGAKFDFGDTRHYLFRDHPAWFRKIALTDRIHWFEDPDGEQGPSEDHAWYVWRWRPTANDRHATLGYAGMPPHEKAALQARMAERRAAKKAREGVANAKARRQGRDRDAIIRKHTRGVRDGTLEHGKIRKGT